jgi:hypothetical protein
MVTAGEWQVPILNLLGAWLRFARGRHCGFEDAVVSGGSPRVRRYDRASSNRAGDQPHALPRRPRLRLRKPVIMWLLQYSP